VKSRDRVTIQRVQVKSRDRVTIQRVQVKSRDRVTHTESTGEVKGSCDHREYR